MICSHPAEGYRNGFSACQPRLGQKKDKYLPPPYLAFLDCSLWARSLLDIRPHAGRRLSHMQTPPTHHAPGESSQSREQAIPLNARSPRHLSRHQHFRSPQVNPQYYGTETSYPLCFLSEFLTVIICDLKKMLITQFLHHSVWDGLLYKPLMKGVQPPKHTSKHASARALTHTCVCMLTHA